MPAMRAQSLLHADLARALRYRDQHDVHQSHAADAEREQADKSQQDLDPRANDLQIHQIRENVEDENATLIFGIEIMVEGHGIAHRLDYFRMIAFVLHHDCGQVIRVGEIAHRGEGDIDVLVDVVVPVLYLVFEHSHDLVGNPAHADLLADGVQAGEEFFLRVGPNHRDPSVSEVVSFTEKTTFCDVHAAHASVGSVNAADAIRGAAGAEGHETLLGNLRRNMLQQRNFCVDVVEIVDRQADLGSGFRTASLELSTAGENKN